MLINRTEIDVRYQETDQMGVVYHANYLVWFEIGRTKLIEQLGFTYADMEKSGIILPVIDAHLSYKKPAKYGNKAYVETTLREYKGVRITYDYNVKSVDSDELLVTGYTKHAFTEKGTLKPIQLRKVNNYWHHLLTNANEGD